MLAIKRNDGKIHDLRESLDTYDVGNGQGRIGNNEVDNTD